MLGIREKTYAEQRVSFRVSEEELTSYKNLCKEKNWIFSDMIRTALKEFRARNDHRYDPQQANFWK